MSLAGFTGNQDPSHIGKTEKLQHLVDISLIDLSEKLLPAPVAMEISEGIEPIALFTKGNFSIITGAAKSRKTFLISMLMAAAIKKGWFSNKFHCIGEGTNIIFDTEQSRYKVQQIAERIGRLAEIEIPRNLLVYSLRTLEPDERIDLINFVLATTPNINFVAIDGIIDLGIDPILQADQAQKIVMKLMQWTEKYNIHVSCILHYNKTVQTLLGHLGSFSHRKADAVIEVAKDKVENVSIVRAVDCREKEFTPFAFSVDDHGMPYLLDDYYIDPKPADKNSGKLKKLPFSPGQLEPEQHQDILKEVFKNQKEQGYSTCWRNIKNAIEKIMNITIGDNRAKDALAYYLSDGAIKKSEQKPKPVYSASENLDNSLP